MAKRSDDSAPDPRGPNGSGSQVNTLGEVVGYAENTARDPARGARPIRGSTRLAF